MSSVVVGHHLLHIRHLRYANFTTPTAEDPPWDKEKQRHQQDAHEFYIWLFERLQKQSSKLRENGIFQGLFFMIIREENECQACLKKKHVLVVRTDLTLPCKDHDRMDLVINQVFQDEDRSGVECDSSGCGGREFTKKFTQEIKRGPDVLITHFNRFESILFRGDVLLRKIDKAISYDEILDLSHLVYNKTSTLRYRLFAAIHHKGKRNAGHYITVTRNIRNDGWSRKDDHRVSPVGVEEALRPGGGFTPYILFWQKIPHNEISRSPPPQYSPLPPPENLKRPHQAVDEDPGNKRIRPPPKKPQTGKKPDAGPADPPNPLDFLDYLLTSRRSGNPASDMEIQKALSDCKVEHARKDDLLQQYRALVETGVICYNAYKEASDIFYEGLEASGGAMSVFSGLMQKLLNKEKYKERAKNFIHLERTMMEKMRDGDEEINKGGHLRVRAEVVRDAYEELRADRSITVPWLKLVDGEVFDVDDGADEVGFDENGDLV
ncbi:MAG: hypothetical protein Q9220_003054 [cf. Caloplaca sp. 1 TL-2023]